MTLLFFGPLQQIEAEFFHLTSVEVKGSFLAGLDQYLVRFLELYKGKSATVGLIRLTRGLDDDVSVKHVNVFQIWETYHVCYI